MALWQFTIQFVPKEVVDGRDSLPQDEWGEREWWIKRQPPHDFRDVFLTMLPTLKSWSEDLLQWGVQASDLVEVWIEEDAVEAVSARIDCRNLNSVFIRNIFDIASDWDCNLVYDRYRTVLPESLPEFIDAIWNSPNHQFMKAPAEWLPKLAKEVSDAKENR